MSQSNSDILNTADNDNKGTAHVLAGQLDMMMIIIIILRTKILFQPVVEIGLLFGGILKFGGHNEVTMAQFKSLPN